jgi:hypothetical protein
MHLACIVYTREMLQKIEKKIAEEAAIWVLFLLSDSIQTQE